MYVYIFVKYVFTKFRYWIRSRFATKYGFKKVLRKENSKKNMVFIEMENRQKYITLMFKLVLKMSHLHLAILAFSPIFGHLKLTYMVTLFLIFTRHTLFENCLKSRISILSFLDFPPIFVL